MTKDLNYYLGLNYTFDFRKIVEADGESYYRATIPVLPGVIAYGDTLDQAAAELEAAKRAWLEQSLADKVNIPEPQRKDYSGRLVLRLPKSLHASLAETAQIENVSLNTLIIERLAMTAK